MFSICVCMCGGGFLTNTCIGKLVCNEVQMWTPSVHCHVAASDNNDDKMEGVLLIPPCPQTRYIPVDAGTYVEVYYEMWTSIDQNIHLAPSKDVKKIIVIVMETE